MKIGVEAKSKVRTPWLLCLLEAVWIFFLEIYSINIYVHVCMHVHASAGAHGVQKMLLEPLELKCRCCQALPPPKGAEKTCVG